MAQAITIIRTTKAAVTGVAGSHNPAHVTPIQMRIFSNRSVHVNVARTGSATTSDMPIYANHAEIINVGVGETINFILATGEVDGDIWFTVV